ncbi:MAG: AbrB/MazE/SpoVT family DNA-binding domain-containing protein [Pseudomonadota bacterium]
MTYHAKITSKGQLTLPAEMRKALGLKAGDSVDFRKSETGSYELIPRVHRIDDLRGMVKLDEPVSPSDIDQWVKDARSSANTGIS